MPIIRRQLKPSDVYPDDLRYNEATETVQSFVNGDWVDNPAADPRRQTTLPPRLTSDPACDAAQSVTDALSAQISSILTAIDNAGTAYTIAGLILGLLAFGPFGIFIGIALFIADIMLSAGTTALEAALTPAVYDTFKCILFCEMDAQGRIDAADLATIQVEVSSQIGGLGATILNAMTSLAGEGGINNLASLGTSTGDCSECDCGIVCGEQYDIRAPFVSPGHGTVTGRTDNSITGTFGNPGNNVGYFIITAEDLGDCCYVTAISGGNGVAFIPCGTAYNNENWTVQTPIGNCCQVIQCQGTIGASVTITFDVCP